MLNVAGGGGLGDGVGARVGRAQRLCLLVECEGGGEVEAALRPILLLGGRAVGGGGGAGKGDGAVVVTERDEDSGGGGGARAAAFKKAPQRVAVQRADLRSCEALQRVLNKSNAEEVKGDEREEGVAVGGTTGGLEGGHLDAEHRLVRQQRAVAAGGGVGGDKRHRSKGLSIIKGLLITEDEAVGGLGEEAVLVREVLERSVPDKIEESGAHAAAEARGVEGGREDGVVVARLLGRQPRGVGHGLGVVGEGGALNLGRGPHLDVVVKRSRLAGVGALADCVTDEVKVAAIQLAHHAVEEGNLRGGRHERRIPQLGLKHPHASVHANILRLDRPLREVNRGLEQLRVVVGGARGGNDDVLHKR